MATLSTSSYKSVENSTHCPYCKGRLYKHGKTGEGKQRFRCKNCKKTHLKHYSYNGYKPTLNQDIIALTKEGVGIRATARLLGIFPTTLISRIKKIALEIKEPLLVKGKTYEVDELRTFVKKKGRLIWVVSAYCREQKQVVRVNVGPRTNKTLLRVLGSLSLASAQRIYTDKLQQYRYLVPAKNHSVQSRGSNRIERAHLNYRTHLKRLQRRSISYSRSVLMLMAVLKIYLWG